MNYIIDFAEHASDIEIQSYFSDHACTLVKEYDHFKKVYLVSCNGTPSITSIVESVIDDESITIQPLGEIITANNYCGLPNPNLPLIEISTTDEQQWWMNYVLKTTEFDAPTTSFSRKGSLSRVYIMDSGIDSTHPEFASTNVTNLFSFTGNFADTRGHGTAIASVIAGGTCGLSSAQLQIVKVYEDGVATRQSDLLSALDAVLGDFTANSNGLGILNCSWSIPKNEYIEAKIRTLINAGMYVVVSAGNSGLPIDSVTPASMPEVLTIGSYGRDLEPSDFSNYTGSSATSNTEQPTNHGALDGWAPGEMIYVAIPGNQYAYVAGTSIAAAIHSCVLAYNFDDYFYNDELLETAANRNVQYLAGMSLSNRNILTLTDPKYANSTNAISTLINKREMESYVQKQFISAVFKVNQMNSLIVFNPQKTKTAEILTDLPACFFITANGLLVGKATAVTGDYEILSRMIRLTLLDDSVIDVELQIGVLSETFDPEQVPEDDPIIHMTLELQCTAGGVNVLECNDDCEYIYGGYAYCNYSEYSKTTISCDCVR